MKIDNKEVQIQFWGRVPYREAWDRQRNLFQELIASPDAGQFIIAVEHDSVYTLGFHGNASNLIASEARLKSMGAECIRIERGGDITYHGPGQLVVYPIIDLRKFGIGPKKYVELLERSVTELLEQYGIRTSSNDDQIGVWLDWGKPTARKICAIGVKISHGVTMHGLALNVNTDLSAFTLINPCGITDKGVTSIQREIGREVSLLEAAQQLTNIIKQNLTNINTI